MSHSQATCVACVAGEIKGDVLLFFGGGARNRENIGCKLIKPREHAQSRQLHKAAQVVT